MELFGYFASILIGLTLGLLGGGGSILAIPILVYLFHLDAVVATAYSLFIVGITSTVGILTRRKSSKINPRITILFGLPSLLAIFATRKWLVPTIPDILLTTNDFYISKRFFLLGLFAILMMLTSILMIRGQEAMNFKVKKSNAALLIFPGIIIGILTGLVGAGGGFLIIPSLIFLTGLSMKEATGTSLLIIGVNSLVGFLGDVLNFSIDWGFLLIITSLATTGIAFGSWLSGLVQSNHLRISFGWFTLMMGIVIILRELFLK